MANLSQKKRQRMLRFLRTIRDEHKDDDDVLIALGEIESELNAKKYGLVWEQHEEAVDVQMRDNIPVFTECKDNEIITDAGGTYNFLLEGDNLHSLRLLEKTHAGRVDLIYIDPPYNTQNKEFIYDDQKIDSTDGFQHSKWISFMYERLLIARNLLSETGVLAISIGHQEVNNLMLLCQELFAMKEVICVTVQTSSGNTEIGLLHSCITQKANMVIPKIGHNMRSIMDFATVLRNIGYGVYLISIDLCRQKATQRAYNRYITTQRYVPLSLVFDGYSDQPTLNYFRIKQVSHDLFSGYAQISTDVPKNHAPNIIEVECMDELYNIQWEG